MAEPNAQPTFDLRDLVVALSEALGLVGGPIIDHGKRVAYLALTFGKSLGLSPEETEDLRTAALLHDAGVSCTRVHKNLIQLDWEGAFEHCLDGAALLESFRPFARPAQMILHHHTKWPQFPDTGVDDRLALLANLIFLADRIDVMLDWNRELILNRDPIEAKVKELSRSYFNPDAVKIFLEKSRLEVFWLSLHPRHISKALARFRPPDPEPLGLDDLEAVASIFAQIVDNKSSFTRAHSEGVAGLCDLFSCYLNFPPMTAQKLRIAGLLHDLGKLAVPDEILEKPAELTPEEFQIIKRHPFETYHILGGLPGLKDIRDWAAFHHEKDDGSGYPFHLGQDDLQIEHHIVALSDIIQALVADRPYRPGLSREHVLDILAHMAHQQPSLQPLTRIVRAEFDLVVQAAQGGRMTE